MTEFDFGPGLQMEQRIDAAETDAITERWEFGRWMLTHVPEGGKKLPTGFLARLSEATGKSLAELKFRRQFAERVPNTDALATVVANHRSWTEIREQVLPADDTDPPAPVEPGPLPAGTYRTIVADPPWRYGNTSTRGAAEDHYPTMTIEELCDLGVVDRVAEDAHLYLWVTNNFLREGFEVLDAWGFDYKTCLTWVKPQMGMGNYFRGSTEHILFGTRGRLPTNQNNIMNWFEAKRGKHSAKPGCFYDMVEASSPGPYLEMFARTARFGDWHYWGNESLETAEVAA
jgi:N6-adenosine-specific RNA methylase IME4